MTDANLLVFGCTVTFIACAGAYVYIRSCFTDAYEGSEASRRRQKKQARGLGRAAA